MIFTLRTQEGYVEFEADGYAAAFAHQICLDSPPGSQLEDEGEVIAVRELLYVHGWLSVWRVTSAWPGAETFGVVEIPEAGEATQPEIIIGAIRHDGGHIHAFATVESDAVCGGCGVRFK